MSKHLKMHNGYSGEIRLVVVQDKRILNESLYYDIVDVYISMHAMNPQEFIIVESNGVRHHFPTEHYKYKIFTRQEKQNDN